MIAGAVWSGPLPILGQVTQRGPMVDLDRRGPALISLDETMPARRASLFAGPDQGMFEPVLRARLWGSGLGAAGLKDLIAQAEAGAANYDAINLGARVLPDKRPSQMTIGEIRAWIKATPGQPHAIGRYQFIPPTLERLVRMHGVGADEVFRPGLQDRLADTLLEEAGMSAYVSGQMGQTAFMNNLAKIWAGLPNATGRSHYHGYAGNKAVISWDQFRNAMDAIFPRG